MPRRNQRGSVRRRGPALENAILDAAWVELTTVGYRDLTMDGIARRAGTSKPVIYRRWPSRIDVVIAALRKRSGTLADRVPNSGSLREDVLSVLRHMTRRFSEIPPRARHGLIATAAAEASFGKNPAAEVMPQVMREVLEHAVVRGEIPNARFSPRILRLPADLVRHEMMVTDAPAPERVLAEIVDEIFLPLVASHPPRQPK